MPPRVSIILPTYDRLDYLREAVGSVRAQTMPDWQLLVADDGSTDGSAEWVASLADDRITFARHAHSGNPALLRNLVAASAKAAWIAFLDSDDRWRPHKLERQLALHDANPHLMWSYTGRAMMDAGGALLPTDRFREWTPRSGWILRDVLALEANIPLPAVMVRTDVFRSLGGFDARWPWSDYELWLRLAEKYECGLVEEPLLDVRSHRSATFGDPRVNLGLADMYRGFRERSGDRALRAVARRNQAIHLVRASDEYSAQQQWSRALAALGHALRTTPYAPFAYRGVARLLARRLGFIARGS